MKIYVNKLPSKMNMDILKRPTLNRNLNHNFSRSYLFACTISLVVIFRKVQELETWLSHEMSSSQQKKSKKAQDS